MKNFKQFLTESPKYVFHTDCRSSTAEWIDDMVDNAKDVSYKEFVRNCVIEWDEYPYTIYNTPDGLRDEGLELENDWSVSWNKGKYRGVPCYFMDHSRIEFIYIKPSDLRKLKG